MDTVRIYASLLGTAFSADPDDPSVIVATKDVTGQLVTDNIKVGVDPMSLVGGGSAAGSTDLTIRAGERFGFRMPNWLVVKAETGAKLAYLVRHDA